MKRFIVPVMIAMLALLVVSAQALQISPIKLGDDKTERGKNATATFTVTNNETYDLKDVTVTTTATADKNLLFSVSGSTTAPSAQVVIASLLKNAVATITVTGKIPLNLDAVDKDLKATSVTVGTLTGTGTETPAPASPALPKTSTSTVNVQMQAENKLEISDLTFYTNGESERASDGDKIDGIKPMDKLRLEATVKNKFADNDEGLDIEDVQLSVEIDDNDFDVDEEEDVNDLSPKDEDTVSFDFDVDSDVDDGTYKLIVKVSGKDQNGALHGEQNEIRLKVERNTHDVTIRQVDVNPSSLLCDENSLRLTTTLANFGRRDERAAAVEVVSPQLKINKKVSDLSLNEDKSRTEAFDLTVPKDTKPGAYRIDVNTYFDNIAKSNTRSVTLNVEPCEEEQEEVVEEEEQPPVVVTPPPQQLPPVTVVPPPTVQPVQSAMKESFKDSTTYLMVLAGLSALVLLTIVALLVVFVVVRRAK